MCTDYCHRVATQLQLIKYIISYHIIPTVHLLCRLLYSVVELIHLLLVSVRTTSLATLLASLLKSELERMWKEAVEACVHSKYCPYIFTHPPVTDILRGRFGPSKRLDTITHGRSIISQKKGADSFAVFGSVAW
jgi:hypothetical protein